MTAQESIMQHWNATVPGCKRRAQSKPRIAYDPGCEFITCEHEDCRCAMNNADGETTTGFIATWETRHGR